MKPKSETIAAKIEAMQAELASAKQAESEAADRELLRLAHKAGIRDKLLDQARRTLDQRKREKAASRGAE